MFSRSLIVSILLCLVVAGVPETSTAAPFNYFYPLSGNGQGWNGTLVAANRSENTLVLRILAYDSAGHLIQVKTGPALNPREQGIYSAQSADWPDGTVSLKLEGDGELSSYILLEHESKKGLEAVYPITEGDVAISFPLLASEDGWWTKVILQNVGSIEAHPVAIAFDSEGKLLGETVLNSLSPMATATVLLTDVLDSAALNSVASILVTANQPIIGIQMIGADDRDDVAALPGLSNFGQQLSLPVFYQRDGLALHSTVGLLNPGDVPANIKVDAVNAKQRLLGSAGSLSVPGHGLRFVDVAEMADLSLAGVNVKATSDQPVIAYTIVEAVNQLGITALTAATESGLGFTYEIVQGATNTAPSIGSISYQLTSATMAGTVGGDALAALMSVVQQLSAPELVSPSNGFIFSAGTASVTAEWSNVTGASSYEIEVSTGSCGATIVTRVSVSANSWTISPTPNPGGTYFWRVRATNSADASPYSNCYSFTITDAAPPTNVTLLAPFVGQVLTGTAVLQASAVDDSGTIQKIEFYINSDTTPACSDTVSKLSSSIFQCSWDTGTKPDGSYLVWAKAYDASNNSAHSGMVYFDVRHLIVNSISPNPIDLASSPPAFTIAGGGFADSGFGLAVVNFMRSGQLLAQVRASSGTGMTLSVPFPGTTDIFGGTLPGLSAGQVIVNVYNQTGANNWSLVGSTSLTVNDTSSRFVSSISPNPIDLASRPYYFTITGSGFASGLYWPVVNFTRNGELLGQTNAESVTPTTLSVPFPLISDIFGHSLPGLTAGPVTVEVYNRFGPNSWSLVGSTSLTVNDTSSPVVSFVSPNRIDLASPPTVLSVYGNRFADSGFGWPVVNFMRSGQLLAQARATSGTRTTVTLPFPGMTDIFGGRLPGLSKGEVTVSVYNQTGANTWSLVGSVGLVLFDSSAPLVSSIMPNPVDLASPPIPFTLSGGGFADSGFGWPVLNFMRNGQLLAQARASSGTATNLSVMFPGSADIFGGTLPGLSAGPVTVYVYNQTGANSWSFIGSISLTINDTRISVSSISPSAIDLASPPASFTIAGDGFANTGFGLPVVNFMRDGQLLAQARAGAGTTRSLTIPYPGTTNIFGGAVPGLSYGSVTVQVYNQDGGSSWSLVGSTTLRVNDSRVARVRTVNALCIDTDQGCVSFTGKLTASEGYTWFATSGNYSPYQSVASATLSNFTLEAVEYGVSDTYSGSFKITAGRRYVLFVTVDENNNLLLIQYDEGSSALTAQEFASAFQTIR